MVLLLRPLWLDFPILDKLSNKFEFGARARNSSALVWRIIALLSRRVRLLVAIGRARARSIIGGIAVEKLCATPAADEILIPRVRFEREKTRQLFVSGTAKLIFLESAGRPDNELAPSYYCKRK